MDGRGSIPNRGNRFSSTPNCPNRFCSPASFLSHSCLGAIPQGVKQLGREGEASLSSSAEVINAGVIPPLTHTSSYCDG
jgi:hypothetical protein